MHLKYFMIFCMISTLSATSCFAARLPADKATDTSREAPSLSVKGTAAILHYRSDRHSASRRQLMPTERQGFAAPTAGAVRAVGHEPAGAAALLVHGAPPAAAMAVPPVAAGDAPVPLEGGAAPPPAGGGAILPPARHVRPGAAANPQRYYAAARTARAIAHGATGSAGGSSNESVMSSDSATGGTGDGAT